jgi:hypothetical protein
MNKTTRISNKNKTIYNMITTDQLKEVEERSGALRRYL